MLLSAAVTTGLASRATYQTAGSATPLDKTPSVKSGRKASRRRPTAAAFEAPPRG
ncbi:MAG TPA: hypothetical protein VGN42_05220 [Pirellulales bacterium]|nr:hypothetical protein [Pirellulales bacterium]